MDKSPEVGDLVQAIGNTGNSNIIPRLTIGTILYVHEDGILSVEWDSHINGHTCGGRCKRGYGWNVRSRDIEVLESKEIPFNSDLLFHEDDLTKMLHEEIA